MTYQTALITGASRGIGAALAERLAEQGTKVALLARSESDLQSLVTRIESKGGRALALSVDVTNAEAVASAVSKVEHTLGAIDLVIANAGISQKRPLPTFTAEDVGRTYQVNLLGVVNTLAAALPAMVERRAGHIVGISSVAAFLPAPQSSAYCASKAALNSQLAGLRVGLKPYGIAVTTICPGFIKTDMTKNIKFPMPFLMELDDATTKMLRVIERRQAFYAFPWQLAWMLRLGAMLPHSWQEWLMARTL